MEKGLNIFIYCTYLIFKKIDYFFKKANPLFLLFRIPIIKKYHKSKGWDPYYEREKIWNDKRNGFNIWISAVILLGVIFGVFLSSFTIISRVFNLYDYVPKFYYLTYSGVSFIIGYLYVFKKDKYLDYFKQYEKWTKNQKRKYVLISFLVIIATIAYFFMSLMCC